MPKFKVKTIFNGEEDMLMEDDSYDDAIFDSEEEAEEAGLQFCSNSREGAEILNLSNPGDYDYDEDEFEAPDYEIIEIDD